MCCMWVTFLLHFFLSWMSSLSYLLFKFYSDFHTFFSHEFPITCPYHLSLPLLMTFGIGSSSTSFLNYSLVVYPLPCLWGESDHPAFSPPARGMWQCVVCSGVEICCVFCLYCEAWNGRCLCMGSVSVLLFRCCMFVSCVHPVAVLNAAFCMTCSLLMLVEDGRGILQSRSHNCLVDNHECLLLFTPCCCSEWFDDL